MRQKALSITQYVLASAVGVIAFVYPFLAPAVRSGTTGIAHADDAPLVLTVLVSLCFLVLLLEVQGQAVNAKFVALLGILVSMNAMLRFLEVALPGPGGLSPIFFLIVMTGYVYGGRLGFLMGALTMLVSALVTGMIGPWLPYQMFVAGWIGMSAPLCHPLVRVVGGMDRWPERFVLALFVGLWGLLFGAIMNLWFWPFAVGPSDQFWEAGIGLVETLRRYTAFYLVTSFAWDLFRAVGNVLLVLAFGAATLRTLRRFHRRFAFDYVATKRADASLRHEGAPSHSSPTEPFLRRSRRAGQSQVELRRG
jgi:energy-coupling factor transport system substrate-specific component